MKSAAEAAVIADLDARLSMRDAGTPKETFQAAIAQAKTRGFSYRQVEELIQGPIEDLLVRIEALRPEDGVATVNALLGVEGAPPGSWCPNWFKRSSGSR